MTTKYGKPARMGLILALFVLLGGAMLAFAASAHAQTPVGPPVSPAGAESPDIVGGREATPGAWPWQVALINTFADNAYAGQFCGGTLIDDEWVLTSARCVYDKQASLVQVLVGAHRLSDSGTRVDLARVILYPDYDPQYGLDHDLALLRLSTPVTYTPIALYAAISATTELDFGRATVIGWGPKLNGSSSSFEYPDELREVSLPLVSNDVCAASYPVTDRMLCAGYAYFGKGACGEDIGGPLMAQQPDSSWVQIGIVKTGAGGCGIYNNQYDIYTRVSMYTDWIATCIATPDACTGADRFEPDNDAASAQPITMPVNGQMHTFHQEGDTDWMRVDVEKGKKYVFMTGPITDTYLSRTTVLWLFDSDGRTPITYSVGTPLALGALNEPARKLWKADRTGTIYISVEMLGFPEPGIYGPEARYWLTTFDMAERVFVPHFEGSSEDTRPLLCLDEWGNPIVCPIMMQSASALSPAASISIHGGSQ